MERPDNKIWLEAKKCKECPYLLAKAGEEVDWPCSTCDVTVSELMKVVKEHLETANGGVVLVITDGENNEDVDPEKLKKMVVVDYKPDFSDNPLRKKEE